MGDLCLGRSLGSVLALLLIRARTQARPAAQESVSALRGGGFFFGIKRALAECPFLGLRRRGR